MFRFSSKKLCLCLSAVVSVTTLFTMLWTYGRDHLRASTISIRRTHPAIENANTTNLKYNADAIYQTDDTTLTYSFSKKVNNKKKSKKVKHSSRNKELISFIKESSPKISEDNTFLCIHFNMGRLGNRMFQYASLYGMAKHSDMIPLVDKRLYDKLYISYALDSTYVLPVDVKTMCEGFLPRSDRYHAQFDWLHMDVLTQRPRQDVQLQGFYQTWMYFYDYIDEIKREFRLNDATRTAAESVIIREASKTLRLSLGVGDTDKLTYVGVHVRHGDISSPGKTEHGAITPPISYYHRSMLYFQARYRNVVFIVTTDDIKWSKEQLFSKLGNKYKIPIFVVTGTKPGVDLAILQMCNHTILSVGTYTFWAGFLNKGESIYYSLHAKPGSAYDKAYSTHAADFYLPYWTPIT